MRGRRNFHSGRTEFCNHPTTLITHMALDTRARQRAVRWGAGVSFLVSSVVVWDQVSSGLACAGAPLIPSFNKRGSIAQLCRMIHQLYCLKGHKHLHRRGVFESEGISFYQKRRAALFDWLSGVTPLSQYWSAVPKGMWHHYEAWPYHLQPCSVRAGPGQNLMPPAPKVGAWRVSGRLVTLLFVFLTSWQRAKAWNQPQPGAE